jgi:hypothetical protein
MQSDTLENAAPTVHAKVGTRPVLPSELDDAVTDPFDDREVFDLLRDINDPEVPAVGGVWVFSPCADFFFCSFLWQHPLTLEELNVVTLSQITVDDSKNHVLVQFTPTIPHCRCVGVWVFFYLLPSPLRFLSPQLHVGAQYGDTDWAVHSRAPDALAARAFQD